MHSQSWKKNQKNQILNLNSVKDLCLFSKTLTQMWQCSQFPVIFLTHAICLNIESFQTVNLLLSNHSSVQFSFSIPLRVERDKIKVQLLPKNSNYQSFTYCISSIMCLGSSQITLTCGDLLQGLTRPSIQLYSWLTFIAAMQCEHTVYHNEKDTAEVQSNPNAGFLTILSLPGVVKHPTSFPR